MSQSGTSGQGQFTLEELRQQIRQILTFQLEKQAVVFEGRSFYIPRSPGEPRKRVPGLTSLLKEHYWKGFYDKNLGTVKPDTSHPRIAQSGYVPVCPGPQTKGKPSFFSREEAMSRGRRVHNELQAFVDSSDAYQRRMELSLEGNDASELGIKFLLWNKVKRLLAEGNLRSPGGHFATKFDFIGMRQGELVKIEWKTGSCYKFEKTHGYIAGLPVCPGVDFSMVENSQMNHAQIQAAVAKHLFEQCTGEKIGTTLVVLLDTKHGAIAYKVEERFLQAAPWIINDLERKQSSVSQKSSGRGRTGKRKSNVVHIE